MTRDQALAQRPQVRFPPHVAGPLTGTVRQVDWAKALSATAMRAIDIHMAARMAQQPDEASRARMATAFGGAYRRLSDHSRAAKFWIDNKDTPPVALLHAHVSPSERGVLETMGEQIPASTSVKGLVTGRFRASPAATSVAVAVPGPGAPAGVATPPVITPPVTPRYTAEQLRGATVAELDARAIDDAQTFARTGLAHAIYDQINRDGVEGDTDGLSGSWLATLGADRHGQGHLLAPIWPDERTPIEHVLPPKWMPQPPPPPPWEDGMRRSRALVPEIARLLKEVSEPLIPDPKHTTRGTTRINGSITAEEKQAMVLLGIRVPTPLTHDESFDLASYYRVRHKNIATGSGAGTWVQTGVEGAVPEQDYHELLRPYIPVRTVGEQYLSTDINPSKVLLQKRLAQLGLAPKCTRCKGTGFHSLYHYSMDTTCWKCNHASDRSSYGTGKGQSAGSGYGEVVVKPATLDRLRRLGPEIAALRQSPEARMPGFQLNAEDIRRFAIGREHVSDTDAFVPRPATS